MTSVRVRYVREVRLPARSAGRPGDVRDLPRFAAKHLIAGGYAEPADAPARAVPVAADADVDEPVAIHPRSLTGGKTARKAGG